jgi:hypothetical protein
MPDEINWAVTTFEGNQLRQQREFLALPLREKLKIIEQMCEVSEFFAARRAAASRTPTPPGGGDHPGDSGPLPPN